LPRWCPCGGPAGFPGPFLGGPISAPPERGGPPLRVGPQHRWGRGPSLGKPSSGFQGGTPSGGDCPWNPGPLTTHCSSPPGAVPWAHGRTGRKRGPPWAWAANTLPNGPGARPGGPPRDSTRREVPFWCPGPRGSPGFYPPGILGTLFGPRPGKELGEPGPPCPQGPVGTAPFAPGASSRKEECAFPLPGPELPGGPEPDRKGSPSSPRPAPGPLLPGNSSPGPGPPKGKNPRPNPGFPPGSPAPALAKPLQPKAPGPGNSLGRERGFPEKGQNGLTLFPSRGKGPIPWPPPRGPF